MSKLLSLCGLAICFTATSFATPVTLWGVSNGGTLFEVTDTSGTFTTTSIGATGQTLTDLAELNGQLYGITATALYSINSGTGAATEIGTGFGNGVPNLDGATFGPNGLLYATGSGANLYTINLTTGLASVAATVSGMGANINTAGDLEFIVNTLYVTTGGQNGTSSLEAFSGISGSVSLTDLGSTGNTNVYGLVLVDGVLYGFTSPEFGGGGEILQFTSPTTSGAVTDVQAYGGNGRNAFSFFGTTDNQVTAPEPGTMGALCLGLLSLGTLAYRRRKA